MKYLLIPLLLLLGVAMYTNSQLVIDPCKPQDCKY